MRSRCHVSTAPHHALFCIVLILCAPPWQVSTSLMWARRAARRAQPACANQSQGLSSVSRVRRGATHMRARSRATSVLSISFGQTRIAIDCALCSAIRGVRCDVDATTAKLNLTGGYWRHSNATLEVWRCKSSGSWSPCVGGVDGGALGDGYCALGYRGPRCEICDVTDYSEYFDGLDARCRRCVNAEAWSTSGFFLLLLPLAAVGGGVAMLQRDGCSNRCKWPVQKIRTVIKIYRRAGMRYKVKYWWGSISVSLPCRAYSTSLFRLAWRRTRTSFTSSSGRRASVWTCSYQPIAWARTSGGK
jgi:hypothetical protein